MEVINRIKVLLVMGLVSSVGTAKTITAHDSVKKINEKPLKISTAPSAQIYAGGEQAQQINQGIRKNVEESNSLNKKIAPSDPILVLRQEYESKVKPLIDSRCQTCHSTRKSNMSDFDSVQKNSEMAFKKMKIGLMPPRPIPPEERSQILDFFQRLKDLKQ